MRRSPVGWADAFCLAVGACDAATGLVLVSAPSWTLHLMRVPAPPGETVYLRWIGVFVGCIGLFYLYPFGLARRGARLRVVLEVTLLARVAVAVFVAAAMAAGALAWQWSSVSVTDLAVASVQLHLLRRGGPVDGPA
jgi:hypothetical protein